MAGKNWVVGLFGFLLVALLLAGYMAMAAESGSRDDPLVSTSYITEELMPNLNKRIDEAIAAKTKSFSEDLNRQYDSIVADLEAAYEDFGRNASGDNLNDPAFIDAVANAVIAKQGGGSESSSGIVETMKKVDVSNGKTVKLSLGSEVLLRLGSANCVASSSPGLIDVTTGGELSNGGALSKNHLYMCTVEGRGFKATADATVFIRGAYTVE